MELSVLVPGIRPGNWKQLYDSVAESFSGTWEIIFCGPYPPPRSLEGKENVKFIEDWGSPVRAQQIALTHATGDYVTWAADDGIFLPKSLDIAKELLKDKDYKTVVVGKYYEGINFHENPQMADIQYYYIYTHEGSRCEFIPRDCLMLMEGLIPRQLLIETGGWDAKSFEVCPMAYNDLSIRFYNMGVKFILQESMMFKCGHMPGTTGDHGPIHNAQTYHDTYIFKMIYSYAKSKQRINLDLNNWKECPSRWERRFGKEPQNA